MSCYVISLCKNAIKFKVSFWVGVLTLFERLKDGLGRMGRDE